MEAERREVNQTPTFVIGDKIVPGAIPYDTFKKLIDDELAKRRRTPIPRPSRRRRPPTPRPQRRLARSEQAHAGGARGARRRLRRTVSHALQAGIHRHARLCRRLLRDGADVEVGDLPRTSRRRVGRRLLPRRARARDSSASRPATRTRGGCRRSSSCSRASVSSSRSGSRGSSCSSSTRSASGASSRPSWRRSSSS